MGSLETNRTAIIHDPLEPILPSPQFEPAAVPLRPNSLPAGCWVLAAGCWLPNVHHHHGSADLPTGLKYWESNRCCPLHRKASTTTNPRDEQPYLPHEPEAFICRQEAQRRPTSEAGRLSPRNLNGRVLAGVLAPCRLQMADLPRPGPTPLDPVTQTRSGRESAWTKKPL